MLLIPWATKNRKSLMAPAARAASERWVGEKVQEVGRVQGPGRQ